MKIIDLLNMISNGEQPNKIKYQNTIYFKSGMNYVNIDGTLPIVFMQHIFENSLNDEVEIIEDKIDKDIKWYFIEEQEEEKTKIAQINMNFKILREKLTEIIDKLNEMEKE